jgi:hypothetical protein
MDNVSMIIIIELKIIRWRKYIIKHRIIFQEKKVTGNQLLLSHRREIVKSINQLIEIKIKRINLIYKNKQQGKKER